MRKFLNIATHYLLGVWVGRTVNNPKYRYGGLATAGSFLFYQLLGVLSKGDEGYLEVMEFMLGNSAALASNRVESVIDDAEVRNGDAIKVASSLAVITAGAVICYFVVKSRD